MYLLIFLFIIIFILYISQNYKNYNNNNNNVINSNDIVLKYTNENINSINHILTTNPEQSIKFSRKYNMFLYYYNDITAHKPNDMTTKYDIMKNLKDDMLNILHSFIHTFHDFEELKKHISFFDELLTDKLNDISIIIEKNIYHNSYSQNTLIPTHTKPFNAYTDIYSDYSYNIY